MRRKQARIKPSFLVQPDKSIDKKYEDQELSDIDNELKKCGNGFEGLKYFINEYIYVPNKIKPEILKEKPSQFKHILFEGDKINLKLYNKQEEYLDILQHNRLTASFKSRQCLPRGSKIYTPEGVREIQDLKPNDAVYSYNEETGEIEIDLVVDQWCSGIQPCDVVEYDNCFSSVHGTNHPFLLKNGTQKRSNEFESGDELWHFNETCDVKANCSISSVTNVGELECFDIETYKNKNFIFEGLVVHNTGVSTITQAYLLQYATFNENKEIVIVSKTEADAIKFLSSLYYMYNHLPFFLRRQYSKAVKKSFYLGSLNKATKIDVLTSTSKSGRSFSATILVIDEAEFIEHVDELWAAAQPTLSATGGQGICISTPWMYKSWFWKVCHNDVDSAFKIFKINWSDIPGRDEEWYKQQCAELNHDRLKIMTELDMQWIIPFQKFYLEDFLKVAKTFIKKDDEIIRYESDFGFGIIREPEEGNEYYFGIDTYEGGRDFNAGVIVDKNMHICCYFKTQRLDIFQLVKFLCDYYKTKACIERNRGFWLIKEFMDNDIHKKYLLYKLVRRKNIFDEQWGYLINGENRKRLIGTTSEYLKYIINVNADKDREHIVIPEALHDEMNYFVIKKAKIEGIENDDLIFALIAALYVRDNKNTFYNWTSSNKNRTGTMELVSKFYAAQDQKIKSESIMVNGMVNNLLASNVLSAARNGARMTEKELNMLEQVLEVGRLVSEQKQQEFRNKITEVSKNKEEANV